MNVTREVILDLLPVYLAGEASPATRQLVEEYVRQEPDLGREIRRQMVQNLAAIAPPSMPADLELKSLRRTRGLLVRQRWLFGAALVFTLLPFSSGFQFRDGRLVDAWLLARDYPQLALLSVGLAAAMWGSYYFTRRRLRTAI